MIERYSRKGMTALWSLETQYRTWLDIEVMVCEALHAEGRISLKDMTEIRNKAHFDIKEISDLELVTKHDVAAFVSVVQKNVGDAGRWIHWGLTSSDIVDTGLCLRLKKAGEMILEELARCLQITRKRALEDKGTLMMGRTHGIHAEPTSMGLKWLSWHQLLSRAQVRVKTAIQAISVGKLSGAVGTYAHLNPSVESFVCQRLGLTPEKVATQVIARDHHAEFFSSLSLLGSAVECIAVELRHLQRTEVSEVREGFGPGQKGSSAMPHKRNPITAENLTGLARLLRGMLIPALENCALWHERDISHSSVERVIAPDATTLADYMLARLATLLEQLEVFPAKMQENMELLQGTIFSQKILLKLVESGMTRDEAYACVQQNALRALDQKHSFKKLLQADARVLAHLSPQALEELFNPTQYLHHIDVLYARALAE